MGNCLRHELQDFSGFDMQEKVDMIEEEVLIRGDKNDNNNVRDFTSSSSSTIATAASSTKVKIRITKKQLEELLGKVEVKELSVQEILSQLINNVSTSSSDHKSYDDHQHQQSWRPILQSIPE